MSESYIVARHAGMTIRIVRSSQFITNVVDERRASVRRPDDGMAEGFSRLLEAIACTAILGAFIALFAILGFILYRSVA